MLHKILHLKIQWKLEDIPKVLKMHDTNFSLREIVEFTGSDSSGLRISNRHYTAYCLRSNDTWKVYDDTSSKILITNQRTIVNVELLVYTI